MKPIITISVLLFFSSARGQNQFDSLQVERVLATLPAPGNLNSLHERIVKAVGAVDKKFRQIADTLYGFKSLKYTILQTIFIETNDSIKVNPLLPGDRIQAKSIVFYDPALNKKVDSIARHLKKRERQKLFKYLEENFNHFSGKEKKLSAQPVRIRYINWNDDNLVHVGIDIYGEHFLWTIDKIQNWEVVKVDRLWVY